MGILISSSDVSYEKDAMSTWSAIEKHTLQCKRSQVKVLC